MGGKRCEPVTAATAPFHAQSTHSTPCAPMPPTLRLISCRLEGEKTTTSAPRNISSVSVSDRACSANRDPAKMTKATAIVIMYAVLRLRDRCPARFFSTTRSRRLGIRGVGVW